MKKVIESAKKFNQELKKSINSAVVAALGLITAFAWKEVIEEYLSKITGFSPIQGKVISALMITIISVLVIMLVTRTVQEQEPAKKE